MKKLIKNISPTIELWIVLAVGFGYFIFSSIVALFFINANDINSWTYNISNHGNYAIVIYEIIALAIIAYFLKIRNWKISNFNLTFTFRLIFVAILLLIIRNIFANIGFKIFEGFDIINETKVNQIQFKLESSWVSMILIIVVNSIFEEVLLIGYLFKRLEKYNAAIVITISMLIRLSYHTYQGMGSLFVIIPTGLVFGYYYFKFKKLWPLIIAHGFSNLLVFLSINFHWVEKLQNYRESLN